MRFRSFALLGLVVVICSGCGEEWQATATCTRCNGTIGEVQSDWLCTQGACESDLETKCTGEVSDISYDNQFVFAFFTECSGFRVAPLPDGVRDRIRQAGQHVGVPYKVKSVETAEEPICPPRMLDLKVTVFHDVPHPECPTAKEVELNYWKKVGDLFEYTTLSAVVPAGGEHEFNCIDAAVSENGMMTNVRVAVASHCDCTLDEGCYIADSYGQIPGDGSSVQCHVNLETLQIEPEFIPPPADATAVQRVAVSAVRRELVPIPDPMFTPGDH